MTLEGTIINGKLVLDRHQQARPRGRALRVREVHQLAGTKEE